MTTPSATFHKVTLASWSTRSAASTWQGVCQQPDNLCDVHDPCPAHAADAARYLAESSRPAHCPTCGGEGYCPDCGTRFMCDDPPPDDDPGGPLIPGDTGYGRAASLALQSLLDDQKHGRCLNCKQSHHTWQCPEIGKQLFAPEPWKDAALGRELCRMRWTRYAAFVTLLRDVRGHGHLNAYAASYQAFIRAHSPDSTLTVAQVLTAWQRMIGAERAA